MTLRPLIFVATFAIAAPAFAQGHSTTGTTVQGSSEMQELVSFADLDLRERSAQRALNHRVIQASERLCIRSEGKFNVDKYLGGWENSCAAQSSAGLHWGLCYWAVGGFS